MAERTRPDRGLIACRRVRKMTDTVVVKFSGGKDSVATWLRCREFFPKIVPIMHYWIPGLEFVERTVRLYEDFFGTKIHQIAHPNLINMMADGVFQPPHRWGVVEAFGADLVDYDEVVDWACEDLGLEKYWVAVGVKASDSVLRAMAIKKDGAVTKSKKLFYPVADMDKAAVIETLRKNNAPVSDDYAVFGRSFDGFGYRYIHKVKEHYPKDYAKIVDWFPLVEAEFARKDAYVSQEG